MTRVIERLAESIPSWGAKVAYGEKTAVDGHELVPVAVVLFGFGGGEGSGAMPEGEKAPASQGEGSGGGGGGFAVPVGAYIAGPEGLRFEANPVALTWVAVPLVTALGLALAGIIRAVRSRGR